MYRMNLRFDEKMKNAWSVSFKNVTLHVVFLLGHFNYRGGFGLTDRPISKVCIFVFFEVGWANGGPREGRGLRASLGSHRP